jgi:predicted DCC family thiol-disulfide oxidoreductase YuxK
MPPSSDQPIILFDGVCGLCNGVVNFLLRSDKKSRFRFAPLQSDAGQALLRVHGLPPDYLDSVVYVDERGAWVQSTGVLRMFRKLGFPYSLLTVFLLAPRFLRDPAYDWICRNRYRWFGTQACRVPTPEEKERFL